MGAPRLARGCGKSCPEDRGSGGVLQQTPGDARLPARVHALGGLAATAVSATARLRLMTPAESLASWWTAT
eukprot:4902673-Lingulodinium_polyedra.AAC.1